MNMRMALAAAPMAMALAACPAAAAPFTVLNTKDYHVIVARWEPEDQPFCAVFQSAEDWAARMRPAAVMGKNTFGPPAALWRDHAVVLIARESNPGDPAQIFNVEDASPADDGEALEVRATFTDPPASTYTMISYVAVAVPKPVPAAVRVTINGEAACEVRPGSR